MISTTLDLLLIIMFLQPSQVVDMVAMVVLVPKIAGQLKHLLLVKKKDSWMSTVST